LTIKEEALKMNNTLIEAKKEAQSILDYCVKVYGLNSTIKIYVKNTNRGNANYYTNKINIPLWSYNRGLNYFYSYVLHEVSHFLNNYKGNYGHSSEFKNIEKKLLIDFGMIPIYKKVYIKELKSESGETLFLK
jgi:hypothetical protein